MVDRAGAAGNKPQSIREVRHPLQKDKSHSKIKAMANQDALLVNEPFSIVADQFVEVRTDDMAPFFARLRSFLLHEVYRNTSRISPDADSIISEENFIVVCRYLTASRVSRVFNLFCGREEGANLIPQGFPIPYTLFDKINSIGVVAVQGGAYRVCPKPEPNPIDPDPGRFHFALIQFAVLVESAEARGGLFRTSSLTSTIEGSSWWFLSARSVLDLNTSVNNRFDEVIVYGAHREWTSLDAAYCASVRNRFSGLLPVENTLKWFIGNIRNSKYNTGPKPAKDEQYVEVFSKDMAPYFAWVRRSLLSTVQRQEPNSHDRAGTISEDDFILVCRYLTAWRAKRIYMAMCMADGDIYSPILPRVPNLELPMTLCDVINGIGVVSVHDGQYRISPKPEHMGRDIYDDLPSRMVSQFVDLVQSAKRRKVISTGRLSSSLDGTSWWLLTARSPDNPNTIASQSEEVTVYGCYKEWTVRDGALCAIVQNRFDGILPVENTLKWSVGTFSGVSALRKFHSLPAEVRLTSNNLLGTS